MNYWIIILSHLSCSAVLESGDNNIIPTFQAKEKAESFSDFPNVTQLGGLKGAEIQTS